MIKKNLLFISFFTILLIAVLHYFSLKMSWYFTYGWMDIVIHMLGGFWVSATSLWVYLKIKHLENIGNIKKSIFVFVLTSVIIVGILWEIFELISGNTFIHKSNFLTDSVSDMINNIIGGTLMYLYVILKKTY